MEDLQLMVVTSWIQGDRTKLLLRVESMERELQLLSTEIILQREAFEAQKELFARRATRQEMLRRVCERRNQDLERQVKLLSERLRASEEVLQRRCLKRSASSERTREGAPAPAPARHDPHRSPKPAASGCVRDEVGELGLVEDNFRLGSVAGQFQSDAHEPIAEPRDKHAATNGVAQTHDPVPVASKSLRHERPGREDARDRGSDARNEGDWVQDGKTIDLDMALSKIQALVGMVRAQEEIEQLLIQELDELRSKRSGKRESLWRLLTRWSRVLKNAGYGVEADARSAGIFEELQRRSVQNPRG